MTYLAVVNNGEYQGEHELPSSFSESEMKEEDLAENLRNMLEYKMNMDPIRDVSFDMQPETRGYFGDLDDLELDWFSDKVIDRLNQKYEAFPVEIYRVREGNARELLCEVDLKPAMIKKVDYEGKDTGNVFSIYFSAYIKECLKKYVEESKWHILHPWGTKPVLYFGPKDKIEDDSSPWMIDLNAEEELDEGESFDEYGFHLNFFFCDEPDYFSDFNGDSEEEDSEFDIHEYFIESIGLPAYYWQIWYFAEGGHAIPDMARVRRSCPVPLEKGDTPRSLYEKLKKLHS